MYLLDPALEGDLPNQHDEDDYPVASSYEALEALVAAPPIDDLAFHPKAGEPNRLTRQAARRMAIQICWAKLKDSGLNRRERRKLMFSKRERIFNFSDLARGIVGLTAQT